jgi:hypothetical protein
VTIESEKQSLSVILVATFTFQTCDESQAYCEEIINAIVVRYGIPHDRAIALMNSVWMGQDFLDEFDVRYHETFEYWAAVLMGDHP